MFGCCTSALDFLLYALDDVPTEKVTTIHSYHAYLVGEGHMGDGHAWALAGSAALLIDVGSYGIKEWLAILGSVVGIGGSIFGIWRAWRYSKSQIVQRLLDYLRDEEAKIKEARNRITARERTRS